MRAAADGARGGEEIERISRCRDGDANALPVGHHCGDRRIDDGVAGHVHQGKAELHPLGNVRAAVAGGRTRTRTGHDRSDQRPAVTGEEGLRRRRIVGVRAGRGFAEGGCCGGRQGAVVRHGVVGVHVVDDARLVNGFLEGLTYI